MKTLINTKARRMVVLVVLTLSWLGAGAGPAVTSAVAAGEADAVGTVVSGDNTPWD
jgi:hypothetical protein